MLGDNDCTHCVPPNRLVESQHPALPQPRKRESPVIEHAGNPFVAWYQAGLAGTAAGLRGLSC
ncbi:hypothetical protein I546_5398 [Mycobacterium kansasii 732]|nr:hypothetical protein I546_5398 [Mycobacterium kansasii 732]